MRYQSTHSVSLGAKPRSWHAFGALNKLNVYCENANYPDLLKYFTSFLAVWRRQCSALTFRASRHLVCVFSTRLLIIVSNFSTLIPALSDLKALDKVDPFHCALKWLTIIYSWRLCCTRPILKDLKASFSSFSLLFFSFDSARRHDKAFWRALTSCLSLNKVILLLS